MAGGRDQGALKNLSLGFSETALKRRWEVVRAGMEDVPSRSLLSLSCALRIGGGRRVWEAQE